MEKEGEGGLLAKLIIESGKKAGKKTTNKSHDRRRN